jgi:hypothetical protein
MSNLAFLSNPARQARGLCDGRAQALNALGRDVYGREYDLDVFNIVAVSDFNMGAMENKGLNIFNDKYILADAKRLPTPISPISRQSSRTNISTTGLATGSPAATGSSSV